MSHPHLELVGVAARHRRFDRVKRSLIKTSCEPYIVYGGYSFIVVPHDLVSNCLLSSLATISSAAVPLTKYKSLTWTCDQKEHVITACNYGYIYYFLSNLRLMDRTNQICDSSTFIIFILGRIVVHFMTSEARNRYQLEQLWALGPEYDAQTIQHQRDMEFYDVNSQYKE